VFCHDFDLSKRLTLASLSQMKFIPTVTHHNLGISTLDTTQSPFMTFLHHLTMQLSTSPSTTIHRVIIPSLLSPALYPAGVSRPEIILQFLHALRALLRRYTIQLTAIITLPLTLHSRTTGLTRWIELLGDGVLELAPFPSGFIAIKSAPSATTGQEDPPQGMLKIHRLPIFHERGGGGGEASGFGNDLAFTLSRRKGFVIKPFSLPPVEGDPGAQEGGLEGNYKNATKIDIEF
jgi:elongator complex protein 4